MRRTITRTLELSPDEVKEAIVVYFEAKGMPVPADPEASMIFKEFDQHSGITVEWTESHDLKGL